MAGPLLETKLHVPRLRRVLVARPRLDELLIRGAQSALTLVSGPAGFGKTTLLAEWLTGASADGYAAAWLSLDQRDNDPALFWPYVVAALRTAAPGIGEDALSLLQSPQPAQIDVVLATLLNDLEAWANDVVLLLDDYHLIEAREIQDGMAFLLEHLPPQVHLVLASRADPPLPMARLRGRGELVEIRAADLRFTADESAEYLNEVMGLDLTTEDVAALERRTEGWITAIQLAALSLRGRSDIAGFIAGFAGDDRYIVDYLAEEVLERQPEDLRTFLLHTSILSRLHGSLCEAVTTQHGGQAMLEALDRGNLFLVPLDDRRQWYRYHHLFADVLHARLLDEQPDALRVLHRRASDWYEHNGERAEAIHHALAGEDFERAAELVELAIPALLLGRRDTTLYRWLEALPDEVIRVRPVLSIGYAGALMTRGDVEGVEARLRDAERWLDGATENHQGHEVPAASKVVDEVAVRRLPGAIARHRAGLAQLRGDVAGTLTHAARALELADEDDHVGRGAAAALLGLAYWTSADLDAALRWYAEGMASLAKAGHAADVVAGAVTLADLRITQGRLRDAMTLYEQGSQRAVEHGVPALRGAADMHVGISQLLYERNDLDAALKHVQLSRNLGQQAGFAQNEYRWRVALARVRQAQGDLGGAVDLLNEAERLYAGDFSPDVRPVSALRARAFLAAGRLGEALGWARERGLAATDDLSYLREFDHITLARVLLAQYAAEHADDFLDNATRLLGRLRSAAEEGKRTGNLLEILVLQSLAHQAGGDLPAALASLHQALTLAEPEGYIRLFVDEGPAMASLLRMAAKQGIRRRYVGQLLAASTETGSSRRPGQPELIEPLSERELDVLRLLGTDLDGPEIARRLIVSLNTMRTHTNHVYAKLGVSNRRAAMTRARELGLLAGTRVRDVVRLLAERGLAFKALPSHDAQSMGGILSTDVHGTGKSWGFISESVVGLTGVDGSGAVHHVGPSDDLFRAAVGGVGAVGVITEVVVQGVPRFNVNQRTEIEKLGWVRQQLDELLSGNDHVSLYLFPFTEHCQVNTWNRTLASASRAADIREFVNISLDALLAAWVGNLLAYTRLLPLSRLWSRLAYLIKRGSNLVLESDQAYNRTIYHLHQELEFTIPFEDTFEVCDRLIRLYEELYPQGLPYTLLEVRFTPAGHDATLLGAGRGRRSTWIDLVCNDSDGYEIYYRAAVQLIKEVGGRPHLGKYCDGFEPADLARVLGDSYSEFLQIAAEHDPDGKFANAFTRQLFRPLVELPPGVAV